jgi:general secretion pathway protein D
VRVEKLPLARILGNLLGPIDMNYDLQGNILYFGKAAEIVKQKSLLPKVTKYYTPHTLDRTTFNTKLQAELAAVDPMLAGSAQISMDPDSSTEGLMFAATKEDMTKLMAIVYRLDGGEGSAEDADDEGGARKTQVFRLRYTHPNDLVTAITSIITTPDGTVQGVVQQDARTRSFIVTARPKWLKKVRQLLDRLDVELQQVSIETKIVEVDADSDNELGINWTAKSSQATADPNINASVLAPVNSIGTLMVTTLQNNLNINATLQAMVSEDKASVLSSPRITTQDNQAGSITTSDTYTYQTTNTTIGSTTQTTVTYNQIAVPIVLNVTPLINQESNTIRMTVHFDVSSVVGVPAAGVPPNESIQTATTMVQVKNGETAIIGGLMRDKLTTTDNKVPVLGDIPLLGYFFKSKVVQKSKKELVIFLTPTISED